MAYGLRYKYTFNDMKGAAWAVELLLNGYNGDPTYLIAGETPLTISYEGDENNIFDVVRVAKATLQIFISIDTTDDIFETTSNITDKTFLVKAYCLNNEYQFKGWLIPDQRNKKLQKDGYYLELLAIDFYSLAKGYRYTKLDGTIYSGKQTLFNIINNLFSRAVSEDADLQYRISHVLNYFGSTITPTDPHADLLQLTALLQDHLIDNDGRTNTGEDIVQEFLSAFGMHVFFSRGYFYLRSPLALMPASIRINQVGDDDEVINTDNTHIVSYVKGDYATDKSFLLSNAENISLTRPSKEVSAQFNYEGFASLIQNNRFLSFTPPDQFDGWVNNYHALSGIFTSVQRVGNGRIENPYAARLNGLFFAPPSNLPSNDGLFVGSTGISVAAGVKVNLSVKFKYYDYLTALPAEIRENKRFACRVYMIDDATGDIWYWVKDFDNTDDDWRKLGTFATGWEMWRDKIVESTDAAQTFSLSTDATPVKGRVYVGIAPITQGTFTTDWFSLKFLDLIYVQLSTSVDSDTNTEIKGNKVYLTQSNDYSQIEDTVDFKIGDTRNISLSGALYQGISDTTTQKWINSLDNSLYPLLRQMVRSYMFFARFPRKTIQCSVYSNNLYFDELIKFIDDGENIINGKYMQMTDQYNVKKCTHDLVCADLSGAFSDFTDIFETYNITE